MTPSSQFDLFHGPTMLAPDVTDRATLLARRILEKFLRSPPQGYEEHAFVFPESRRFLVNLHEDLLRRLSLGRRAEVESIVSELVEDRACLEAYIEPFTRTFDDYVEDMRALVRILR
jgi:hypothetical protein